MNAPGWKLAYRILGAVVLCLSIVYVGHIVIQQGAGLRQWRPHPTIVVLILGGALVYALAGFLLTHGWNRILMALDVALTDSGSSARIYARTQIAKYVPGNVLQIASRHAATRSIGIGHKELAFATMVELVSLCGVAVAIAIAASLLRMGDRGALVLGGGALVLVLGAAAASRLAGAAMRRRLRNLLLGVLAHVAFFVIAATVFAANLWYISGTPPPRLESLQALTLGWVAGIATPGSPSGIGVREAVMTALLGGHLDRGAVLIALASFRITTTFGDLLFFAQSFLPRRSSSPAS